MALDNNLCDRMGERANKQKWLPRLSKRSFDNIDGIRIGAQRKETHIRPILVYFIIIFRSALHKYVFSANFKTRKLPMLHDPLNDTHIKY